jgi:transcription elongation factor GreA
MAANEKQSKSSMEVKLTAEGLKQLEEELEYRKTVKRKEIADEIKVALSFGDLSENSEYDEAKNNQGQNEARILELETRLKHVVVIDESDLTTDVVRIGVKVRLLDVDLNEVEIYQIVGSTEANPLGGSISDECPVGRAVMGKHAGETFEVETPGGVIHYKVVDISRSI